MKWLWIILFGRECRRDYDKIPYRCRQRVALSSDGFYQHQYLWYGEWRASGRLTIHFDEAYADMQRAIDRHEQEQMEQGRKWVRA